MSQFITLPKNYILYRVRNLENNPVELDHPRWFTISRLDIFHIYRYRAQQMMRKYNVWLSYKKARDLYVDIYKVKSDIDVIYIENYSDYSNLKKILEIDDTCENNEYIAEYIHINTYCKGWFDKSEELLSEVMLTQSAKDLVEVIDTKTVEELLDAEFN